MGSDYLLSASDGLEWPLIAQVPRPFSLTMRPPASAHVPTTADAILVVGAEAVPKTALAVPKTALAVPKTAPVVVVTAETEKAETAAAEKAKAARARATVQSMAVAARAAAEKAATDAAAKAAVAKAAAEKAAAGKAAAEMAARDRAAAEKARFTNVLRVCLPAAAAGDAAADAAGGASGAQDGASGAQDGGTVAKLAALQLTVRSLSGEMRSEMQALDQRPSEVIKSCSGEMRSEMQALSQTVDELRSALARLELTRQVTFGEKRLGERLLDGEQLANSLRECLHLRSQRDPSAAAIRPQSDR